MPSTDDCPSPGDVIVVDPETRERLRDCVIPEGVTFRIFYREERPMDPETPDILTAETVPASDGPPDLTAIAQAAGGDSTLTIALALLAVVGGAAGWKFWTQLSTQKHEQKMKALELEAQKAGLGAAQPPPCQIKQLEVEKRLDALDKKQAELSRKVGSLIKLDGPSNDELDERLVKLEKKVRSLPA